jgi:hypothetical protein
MLRLRLNRFARGFHPAHHAFLLSLLFPCAIEPLGSTCVSMTRSHRPLLLMNT